MNLVLRLCGLILASFAAMHALDATWARWWQLAARNFGIAAPLLAPRVVLVAQFAVGVALVVRPASPTSRVVFLAMVCGFVGFKLALGEFDCRCVPAELSFLGALGAWPLRLALLGAAVVSVWLTLGDRTNHARAVYCFCLASIVLPLVLATAEKEDDCIHVSGRNLANSDLPTTSWILQSRCPGVVKLVEAVPSCDCGSVSLSQNQLQKNESATVTVARLPGHEGKDVAVLLRLTANGKETTIILR